MVITIIFMATASYAFDDIAVPAQCEGQSIACVQGVGTCTAEYCPNVYLYDGTGKFIGIESNCPNQCTHTKTCSCGTYTWEVKESFKGSVKWQ